MKNDKIEIKSFKKKIQPQKLFITNDRKSHTHTQNKTTKKALKYNLNKQ